MDHPVTLEQERKVWTIHQSVNGTTYYYNRATKKSQYQMPECFKTTEEVLEHPDWKEYRTAEGKKFYYNAITRKSCWQLPNQVKEYRIKLQQKRRKDREEGRVQQEEVLSQSEVIKRKFMTLLKHKLIGVSTKWDACIKLCEDDDRWQLLKISDKKKYYLQYVNQLKKVSQKQKRAKTEVNKIQFIKMLKQNKTLTSDCKMHKIAYDFMADPRWRLLDEHQRQNTFQNYMDELWQKQKQIANTKKQALCISFRTSLENNSQVKYNTKWDQIRNMYKHQEQFKEMHPYEQITTFMDYIFDAEKRWEEEQAKEKRLRQRINRINYRDLLRQKIAVGEIGYKTRWRDFLNDFRNQKVILAMLDPSQPGTSAHQIFQHFMQDLRERHKLIKSLIKHHFKKLGFKMIETTSRQQFYQKLADMQEFIELPPHLQSHFFHYFLMKIKTKKESKQASAKKSSKKQRKVIFKIFQHLQTKGELKNKYSIQNQMDYVQKSMRSCGFNVTPQTIFKYYLAFLQSIQHQQTSRKRSKSKSDSSYEGKRHKRKHKIQEIQDQQQFVSTLRKFTIPELNQLKKQQMNQAQEEGQIKDDSGQEEIKKKHKSKKKKKSSSSDSD